MFVLGTYLGIVTFCVYIRVYLIIKFAKFVFMNIRVPEYSLAFCVLLISKALESQKIVFSSDRWS